MNQQSKILTIPGLPKIHSEDNDWNDPNLAILVGSV
jgi:hypothetical protein